MKRFETSDEWLTEATDRVLRAEIYRRCAVHVPPVRVSVGFGTRGLSNGALAQTLPRGLALDGVNEVYIRPTLHDPTEVLTVLVGELIRASFDGKAPNGKRVEIALANMGISMLRGSAVRGGLIPTPELETDLRALAESLGDYPRANGLDIAAAARAKQSTRMIRCECSGCGFLFRTSQSWIDKTGTLSCPSPYCASLVNIG